MTKLMKIQVIDIMTYINNIDRAIYLFDHRSNKSTGNDEEPLFLLILGGHFTFTYCKYLKQ